MSDEIIIFGVLASIVFHELTQISPGGIIVPGYIAWGLVSLWFLYRIVSGFVAMNKGQEIGTP